MERIMGLDLGSRTLGIAVSDPLGMIARTVETFRRMTITTRPAPGRCSWRRSWVQ